MDVSLNIGMLAASHVDVPTSALEGTIAGLALAVALCAVQAVQRMIAKRNGGSGGEINCPNKIHELPGYLARIGSATRRIEEKTAWLERDMRQQLTEVGKQQSEIIHCIYDMTKSTCETQELMKAQQKELIVAQHEFSKIIRDAVGHGNKSS